MRWLAVFLALAIGLPAAEARPRSLLDGFTKAFSPTKAKVKRKKRYAAVRKKPTKVGPARYVAEAKIVQPQKVAASKASPDLPRDAPVDAKQTGIASWYGPGFHGRLTACGAIKNFTSAYNEWRMTAAHRTLKCGTVIEVHANGKVVDLTITDRGPFIAGRILDVSRGAAQELGMMKSGTAKVTFYVLGQ